MKRAVGGKFPSRRILGAAMVLGVAMAAIIARVDDIRACGPYLSFRAYLTRGFWLPMYYSIGILLPPNIPGGGIPYAGFSAADAPEALSSLREAYRRVTDAAKTNQTQSALDEAGKAATRALAPGALSNRNLEEARLIACKIALRGAERNPEALAEARRKMEEFIGSAADPVFASEARGWLARICYLQKDYVRAALIYLDEVNSPQSPVNRDTLVTSLRWVYSAGENQLWEHLEEFFDTPRHALFTVNLITNQYPYGLLDTATQPRTRDRGGRVLKLLQGHPELFTSGADSEALVLALMRASLYLGDPAAALKYASALAKSEALQANPEFNWMTAIAHFVQRDYARAEGPLLRMLRAPSATGADRITAAQALVGVYLKTHRPVDALHAAFIQSSQSLDDQHYEDFGSPRMQWCFYGLNLDLPYLLDAYLSDEDLREYLHKYPKPVGPPLRIAWGPLRELSAPQAVRYSLVVRFARHEEYEEAEKVYTELGFGTRARRMKILAGLLARTRDAALSTPARLTALYDYGTYLADNPERLFFNDLFWRRMQRSVFLETGGPYFYVDSPRNQPGLTAMERQVILADDRTLRDQQEERWQAYKVLEQVANESGHSALGQKAAEKIIDCLSRINTLRFGREVEIRKAISTWKRWLRE
jgi:hypothetical protein